MLSLIVSLLGGCKFADTAEHTKPDFSVCENQARWTQWEALVEQLHSDDGMMELYALRLGICSMLYTGQIEPERGIRMLNKLNYALLKKIAQLQTKSETVQQKQAKRRKKKRAKRSSPPAMPPPQTGVQ